MAGNRIKIRHGSTAPSTSNLLPYELGWDGTNLALYINNNDGTPPKAIGGEGAFLPLTGGTLTGLLKITTNGNTTTIGSQNALFCHIYNGANIPFIFNNTITTTTGDLGTTSYPWNNLYIGPNNGAGIYYKGTKATLRMIRFIDNTADATGNGIAIGGGGQTIIGGGESADTMITQVGTAGAEFMFIGNDSNIDFYTNLQTGWASGKHFVMDSNGDLTVPRYLYCNYLNASCGTEIPTINSYWVYANSDGFLRKSNVVYLASVLNDTSRFINSYPWWGSGDTHDVNDLRRGVTFAYHATHNSPTTGTIVAFDCSTNNNYGLQIQGDYYYNRLFYRNRQGDQNTWKDWMGFVYSDSARRIFVTTSATVPSGANTGDIVLVKAS